MGKGWTGSRLLAKLPKDCSQAQFCVIFSLGTLVLQEFADGTEFGDNSAEEHWDIFQMNSMTFKGKQQKWNEIQANKGQVHTLWD